MVEDSLPWLQAQSWSSVSVFGDIDPELLAIDLLLARGDVDRAAVRAGLLVTTAAAARRQPEHLGGLIRLATASHELRDGQTARSSLRRALAIADAFGYLRTLRVPGCNLNPLFQHAWDHSGVIREQLSRRPDLFVPLPADGQELPRREAEILRLVAGGLTNKQIANSLFISPLTVRNHLGRIYRQLDATSRTEAVAVARRRGLISSLVHEIGAFAPCAAYDDRASMDIREIGVQRGPSPGPPGPTARAARRYSLPGRAPTGLEHSQGGCWMYGRVVIPIEGPRAETNTLDAASIMARLWGVPIQVIRIKERKQPASATSIRSGIAHNSSADDEELAGLLRHEGFDMSESVVHGSLLGTVDRGLLRYDDLAVMSSQGAGDIWDDSPGWVHVILRQSSVTTLVVGSTLAPNTFTGNTRPVSVEPALGRSHPGPSITTPPARNELGPSRVAVLVDGTTAGFRALSHAGSVARRMGVPLVVAAPYESRTGSPTGASQDVDFKRWVQTRLEASLNELGNTGVETRFMAAHRDNLQSVIELLDSSELLVLGSPAHTGLSKELVVRRAVGKSSHASMPVLIVRR